MSQELLDDIYASLWTMLDNKRQEALDLLIGINGFKIETLNDFTFYYFGERNAAALFNDDDEEDE